MRIIMSLLLGLVISAGAEPLHTTGLVLPYQQVDLAVALDGVVTDVLVKEGDAITNGQVIARLDSPRETLEVDYQKAILEKRIADLAAAESLFNEKIFSKNQLDERRIEETALHELTGRTLRLQDEERRRLARELHDTTAQNLAALNMNLAVLEQALPPEGERLRALLADCQNLTDRSAQEIRTLAYLLHPPLLEEFGLARAARDYAEGFGQRSGIRVELSLEEALGRLPEEMELSLFRVLQESLGNVHRHSGSAVVRIRLAREAGAVCLEIADEGRGLPGGAVTGASVVGVGIQGMRERLQQLGGRLELTSGLPGVRVRAMLPLQEAKL